MKKFFLLFTLSSVALASCVNDESLDLTQQPKKLSFEAPVMGTQSRANYYGEIQGGDYPTDETFMVFAKMHIGDLTNWDNADNFWVEGDAKVTVLEVEYDGTQYWDTSTDHYWPSGDNIKLSFGAYSPAALTGASVVATYTDKGLTITGFEVNATVANQVDLMYSGPILNQTYKDNATGVSVVFKHALSSIVFSAIDLDDKANYTINSIKVNGKFLTKGTFFENLSTINGTGTAGWKDVLGNTKATEYTLATGLDVSVGGESTIITEKTSALLTIPQAQLDSDATVTIAYTVTPETGAKPYQTTKTVKLADFEIISTDTHMTSWEMGKRYTYQFSFGGTSKIFFKPTVTTWANGATATLKIN